jgi:methyl-accepting chemotaxis protein
MLNNLKVRNKLFLFSIVMISLLIFLGGVGYYFNSKANEDMASMYNERLLPVQWLNDNRNQARAIEADICYIILSTQDKEEQNKKLNDIQDRVKLYDENWQMYKNTELDDFELNKISVVESNLKEYREARNDIIKLAMEGKQEEALEKYKDIDNKVEEFQKNLKELAVYNSNDAQNISIQNTKDFNISSKILMIIGLLSIFIGVILSVVISRTIVNPLKAAVEYIKVLSKRDFTQTIHESFFNRKDEMGDLANSIFIMQDHISTLIKDIMEKSQDVNATSEELSATVEELTTKAGDIETAVNNIARDVQETSASAEEISASVQEANSSINILSDKATEGSDNASQSKDRALTVQSKGKTSVAETRKLYEEKKQKTLKAIEDGKIVENIKVMADTIADISEQTNLLALNAAIEATRAGEQGKGFAVVAEEVRTLAEQSSQAVTSIKDTIIKVQEAFKNLSDNSKDVLQFILEDVDPQFENMRILGDQYYSDAEFVTKMSEEIASMSEELTATVNQVSEAIQNNAEISQKSSENVETIRESINETARAIQQVAQTAQDQALLAEKLNEMICKFKV